MRCHTSPAVTATNTAAAAQFIAFPMFFLRGELKPVIQCVQYLHTVLQSIVSSERESAVVRTWAEMIKGEVSDRLEQELK